MGRSLCHCEDRQVCATPCFDGRLAWVVLVAHRNSLVLWRDWTGGVPLDFGKVGSKLPSGFTLSGGTWG